MRCSARTAPASRRSSNASWATTTPTEGDILVGGREQAIGNPKDAHALGLGMVYQHFTLVPAMTVAENLVLARDDVPAVVNWPKEMKELEAFLARMPFKVPLSSKSPTSPPASGRNARSSSSST